MADTTALLPPGADLFLSDDGTKIKGYDTTPGAGPWYAAETVREHVAPLVGELQRLRAENERLTAEVSQRRAALIELGQVGLDFGWARAASDVQGLSLAPFLRSKLAAAQQPAESGDSLQDDLAHDRAYLQGLRRALQLVSPVLPHAHDASQRRLHAAVGALEAEIGRSTALQRAARIEAAASVDSPSTAAHIKDEKAC